MTDLEYHEVILPFFEDIRPLRPLFKTPQEFSAFLRELLIEARKRLGFGFVGIEREVEYYEIAVKRVQDAEEEKGE